MRAIAFIDAAFLKEEVGGSIDGRALISGLVEDASFLHSYWYEGAYDPLLAEKYRSQRPYLDAIGNIEKNTLRLGDLVWQGSGGFVQKQVDVLLALDMVQLAQVGAYDVAWLYTGDADFIPAVEAVLRLGKSVILRSGATENISNKLLQTVDEYQQVTLTRNN